MIRLTQAQRRILAGAARHPSGRVVGGDPRTRAKLLDLGLIAVDGHLYGPLYAITDAGRAEIVNARRPK